MKLESYNIILLYVAICQTVYVNSDDDQSCTAADWDRWIGLQKTGDDWVWTDGTVVDYTNWRIQAWQPNGDGECTLMSRWGDWFDISCDDYELKVMCKRGKFVSVICYFFSFL